MRSMPRAAAAYVVAVVLLGAAVLAVAASRPSVPWLTVALLAGLYWVAAAAPVRTSVRSLVISMGFPVGLAAVLLLGPWSGALVCWAGAFTGARDTVWYKRAFNGSQMALSAFAAGYVYQAIPGSNATHFEQVRFPQALPAVVVAGIVLCAVNYLMVATAISLTGSHQKAAVWRSGLSEIAASSLGYGLLGLVIAVLWSGGVGPVAALLILAPMLIARWAFRQYGEQHKAYEATVASLIRAVETKDYYTRGHSERVAKASVMLAEQLKMHGDRLEMLRYAGMLHDVGKLGVPTKLLQKTGPLDEREFAAIQQHPSRGFEMVEGISFLEDAMLAIRHHHERVDGTGYPDGLAGDQIPEFARVIAVADAFDSMTSTRSYRGARTVPAAIAELRQWAGSQFDATMVEALVAAVEARGWQASTEAVPDVVATEALVFGDHDDPSSLVAAFHYRVRTAHADLPAEVS